MKTGLLILLFVITMSVSAQDTLTLTNSRLVSGKIKEIGIDNIVYETKVGNKTIQKTIKQTGVAKIKYERGRVEFYNQEAFLSSYNYLITHTFDSGFVKKNFVRLYITDVFKQEFRIGYERLFNKYYSFEGDAMLRWRVAQNGLDLGHFQPVSYPKNFWCGYMMAYSEGFEIRGGVSRHFNFEKRRLSALLLLGYTQLDMIDVLVFNGNSGWPAYSMNQKSKGPGLFIKLNYQHRPQHSGLEIFVQAGTYWLNNTNYYHWYRPYSSPFTNNTITNPDLIPTPLYTGFQQGRWVFGVFRLGIDYVIKQPRKKHADSTLKPGYSADGFFKRKNILFANLSAPLDGGYGVTYMRVIYKPGITLVASGNIGNNKKPFFTNASLIERTLLYRFDKKNFDYSLGVNYNLSENQKTFGYVGLSARFSQFEGTYHFVHQFTVNRYYAMMNAGFVMRSLRGISFNCNASMGHYENVYIKNNPDTYIKTDNFRLRKAYGINCFLLSFGAGYSF